MVKSKNMVWWIVGIIIIGILLYNYNPELFSAARFGCSDSRCKPIYYSINDKGCYSLCGLQINNIKYDSCNIDIIKENYKDSPNVKLFSDSGCRRSLDNYNCVNRWRCGRWESCSSVYKRGETTKTRECRDINYCGNDNNKPITEKECPVRRTSTSTTTSRTATRTTTATKSCVPNCKDRYCGDDGCGGSCGDCSTSTTGSSCRNGKCSYRYYDNNRIISSNFISPFSTYTAQRKRARIPDKYLYESEAYDYNRLFNQNPGLRESLLLLAGNNPKHAAIAVSNEVHRKVKYDLGVINESTSWIQTCLDLKSSEIYAKGRGICSTMSQTSIAMLRGIGLAARMNSGCVNSIIDCNQPLIWAIISGRSVKSNPIIDPSGRHIIAGNPHAWVEVWLPDTGWTILDPTGNFLVDQPCDDFYTIANEDRFNAEVDRCSLSGSKASICDNKP